MKHNRIFAMKEGTAYKREESKKLYEKKLEKCSFLTASCRFKRCGCALTLHSYCRDQTRTNLAPTYMFVAAAKGDSWLFSNQNTLSILPIHPQECLQACQQAFRTLMNEKKLTASWRFKRCWSLNSTTTIQLIQTQCLHNSRLPGISYDCLCHLQLTR